MAGLNRLITRGYICHHCGAVRKAAAYYLPNAPPPPNCCGVTMDMLSYEQAVACTRMTKPKRIAWLLAGGKVERRGGKRRWKAVR